MVFLPINQHRWLFETVFVWDRGLLTLSPGEYFVWAKLIQNRNLHFVHYQNVEEHMFGLLERLRALEQDIQIGIVGIGSIGKGMALQPSFTPGIKCVAIADIDLEKAAKWAEEIGQEPQVVSSADEMHDAIRQGKMAVCEDGQLIAQCELIDVFMEATNTIREAAQFIIAAIQHHTHVVNMNY
jgi:predicted homoserine dehydrogenase-like protein